MVTVRGIALDWHELHRWRGVEGPVCVVFLASLPAPYLPSTRRGLHG